MRRLCCRAVIVSSAHRSPSADAVSFIEQYQGRLRRFLLRRLHGRPQDADDLTQEVCLRFLLWYQGQPLYRPLAYLYRMAVHAVHDLNRRRSCEQQVVVTDSTIVEHLLELSFDPQRADPADYLAVSDQLRRALGQLPPSHRAVLLAHKRDGMSYAEVARETGLSVHTVEKYLTQARAQLRAMRPAGKGSRYRQPRAG